MLIKKDDRSPFYFGAVARKSGQYPNENPYGPDDPRRKDWLTGFTKGQIEERWFIA